MSLNNIFNILIIKNLIYLLPEIILLQNIQLYFYFFQSFSILQKKKEKFNIRKLNVDLIS